MSFSVNRYFGLSIAFIVQMLLHSEELTLVPTPIPSEPSAEGQEADRMNGPGCISETESDDSTVENYDLSLVTKTHTDDRHALQLVSRLFFIFAHAHYSKSTMGLR